MRDDMSERVYVRVHLTIKIKTGFYIYIYTKRNTSHLFITNVTTQTPKIF